MISDYYNITFKIQRLTEIEDTNKESYVDYLTGLRGVKQPLDTVLNEDLSGQYGQDYLLITPKTYDIAIKDRLVDNTTGDSYIVVGIRSNEFIGSNDHLEIIIRDCDV